MARKTFPGAPLDILNCLTMDCFIASLDSPDLCIGIRKGNPKTLDKSLSGEIQLEAIKEAETGSSHGKSGCGTSECHQFVKQTHETKTG